MSEGSLLIVPSAIKLAAELIFLPAVVAADSFAGRLHYELRPHQTGIAKILGLVDGATFGTGFKPSTVCSWTASSSFPLQAAGRAEGLTRLGLLRLLALWMEQLPGSQPLRGNLSCCYYCFCVL